MKIIQNGGGAVLFRPWHEASGTWFWWSMEGAGQYNRLWVYTYNFMRAQGVHNLVYLHPFNGSPSSAWYPGKQYVDIGGADTYAGDHGPLTSMFNAARNVYGGTIPIALHENGRIPDPAQLQSSGTRWVLFNTWHTELHQRRQHQLAVVHQHRLQQLVRGHPRRGTEPEVSAAFRAMRVRHGPEGPPSPRLAVQELAMADRPRPSISSAGRPYRPNVRRTGSCPLPQPFFSWLSGQRFRMSRTAHGPT